MNPLICPLCWTVAVLDAPPKIGEPHLCPCMDRKPFTAPVAMVRLVIPQGYELRRVE